MEPAKIDWKRIESIFVQDERYEHINAPKWFDFLAPEGEPIDDETWFCRPDCRHPKTAEDFLKSTPSKLLSPGFHSEIHPLGDHNRRDVKLKRRVPIQSSISPTGKLKLNMDSENQNPNLSTPPHHLFKPFKAAIKSSTEKKPCKNTEHHNEVPPPLRSTLSAKNLFAGRDILNHISEFCNEIKKLATRAKERETAQKLGATKSEELIEKEAVNEEDKERMPLLEVGKAEKLEGSSAKGNQLKKRLDDAENTPPPLNLEKVKQKREENLLNIRTNPPSPQCFSATCGHTKSTTSKVASKSRLERGVLKEVEQKKNVILGEESEDKNRNASIVDTRAEAKALDVFWFLKPCSLSTWH